MNLNSESQLKSFSRTTTWALPTGLLQHVTPGSKWWPMAGSKNDDRGSKVRKYVNREVTSEFCLFLSLDSNRFGNLFRTLVPIGKRCILWIQADPSCCTTWRFPFLVQFVCLLECFRPAGRAAPLCLREPPSARHARFSDRDYRTDLTRQQGDSHLTRGNGKQSGTSRGGSAKWTPRGVGHCGELLLSLTHFLVL